MTLMVITCGDCGVRFRLDLALLKGAKGIRVRCRRCGGKIVVLRPESPPVISADDVLPTDADVASAEPRGRASPAPEEATDAGADIPDLLRPEPAPPPPDEMTTPPSSVPALDLQETVAGEDVTLPQPVPKPDVDLPPAPEEAGPSEEIVPPVPERKVFLGGRAYLLKYLILAGISILLLAGGTLYFGTSRTGSDPERPIYDIRGVTWYFDKDSAAGNLFVIKGSVANVGNAPSAGIRIQATLLGKDNEALASKAAFAGNLLDEASLRKMDVAGIERVLANRFGEGNVNRNIHTGNVLPFMVVLTEPPRKVESFIVKAIDVK